ncbi:MAG: M20 family metallopeptidase [Oscillospiraceae bacterium]
MTFLEQAALIAPELQALKDDLHRHPEVSFGEHRTTAILREKLTALGLTLIDLGMETGVVAVLQGDLPGKTVALRADIDAIFQQEPPKACTSENDGVMHACGHDFHTACLFGAARLLTDRKQSLHGSVVFLFQPAEEVTQGAAAMVAHGLWDKLPTKPQCLFGLHNRPELPVGQVAVLEGPIMAGKTNFEVKLHGVTGHGGSPHKCVDVIVAGAALVSGIQTIVSRNADPLESLVCAVCSIHSGTAENFSPDLLTLTGSVRAHNPALLDMALNRIEALSQSTAAGYGCTAEVRLIPQVPVTYNRPELAALARLAAERTGLEAVTPRPDLGSEDFSVLGETVPSFFYWLGTGKAGAQNPCWHSPQFTTDDRALPMGAALLAESALAGLADA